MNIPKTLKTNTDKIIKNLSHESIDVYCFLKDEFSNSKDIRQNYIFHFVYRSFYRLDNAGLTNEFKTEYFNLMQQFRNKKTFDIPDVCKKLYEFVSLRGYKTLQFSFTTKMANTIDENLPIYDSEVASIFGFKTPYNYKSFDERLSEYIDFYTDLKNSYHEFQNSSNVQHVINHLRSKFPNIEKMSVNKQLDFILWSAGNLKSNNQLKQIDT